ncbi:MAG: hypothetical protein P8M77_05080 [Porticoccaceae bacterium]|nr:hypothetical protein [Porticoccaceae bacterium]
MNVKRFISEIREDKVVGRSLFAGIGLLAVAAVVLWQLVMVDARAQAMNLHFGLNMKIAASRVDTYLDNYQQQLEKLASQPEISQSLAEIDNAALDRGELNAAAIITDAESILFIDRDLQRHKDSLSFAATQMARSSLRGETISPRAIKIDGQWKVLISKILLPADSAAESGPLGVILIQLPITGLRFALSAVDVSNGSLLLQQVVPNRSDIVLLRLGEPAPQAPEPELLQADQITLFDTANPLWKISFSPSSSLIRSIEATLPPFWLLLACANILVLLAVYLLASLRVGRRSLITDIFIEEHNAKDALFAGPSDEDLELIAEIEEVQTDSEEPQPEIEEPQPETKELHHETKEPQPEIEEPQLEISESQPQQAEPEDPLPEVEEPPQEVIEAPALPKQFVLPDVVFRNYDIRGIAGTEVTAEFALRLGKTIGTIILQNGHTAIYIGRDGRLSSLELSEALQAGLLSTGCNVINLGEITTPVLNFAVHHCGQSSCGIMITASHNPAVYNGFKIIIQRQVISGKALQLLKPMLTAEKFTRSESGQQFSRDIVSQYVRHIVENSSIDRSFRLVIDAGNSVAGPVALKLFDSLGCLAFPINCDVDGSFPNHEPNPADENNLKQLISKVKEVKADLGLAFDGDGDRLVVISGKGQIIWPDQLMMLFARDILKRNPGADIVFDVKSSKRLAEMVRKHSGRPVMCKTGHSHVRKAVHHNKAPLGGEFSGHIFFNDRWKGFDDGLYAATRLLEILCSQRDSADKTLDQMIGRFDSSSYTSEILIPVPDDEKFKIMQTMLSGCQFGGAQIVSLDGLRAEYLYGWGLIRASNTSANLTLRFEADDDASLEQVKQAFRRELKPFINQIEDYI